MAGLGQYLCGWGPLSSQGSSSSFGSTWLLEAKAIPQKKRCCACSSYSKRLAPPFRSATAMALWWGWRHAGRTPGLWENRPALFALRDTDQNPAGGTRNPFCPHSQGELDGRIIGLTGGLLQESPLSPPIWEKRCILSWCWSSGYDWPPGGELYRVLVDHFGRSPYQKKESWIASLWVSRPLVNGLVQSSKAGLIREAF